MFKHLAPLVPMSLVLLLAAYTSHSPEPQVAKELTVAKGSIDVERNAIARQDIEDEGTDSSSAGMPALVSNILECAFGLVGTPYRFGGATTKGFDYSSFVGYLLREEAGIKPSHSTRELIDMGVPLISKDELQSGDLLFFNNRGRGRVSHAGIYIGDNQFVHSASRRGGGVRVNSLDSNYWSPNCMEAKWMLEPGYKDILMIKRQT